MENYTLKGLLFKKCFVFIDDILVIGKSWAEMMENLGLVLFRLQTYGFKLKPSKLPLGLQRVPMLGFVLNRDTIEICKNKMAVTEQWKTPVDKATAISFVQFCSYLRRSIPDFGRIAKPLYELSQQDKKFEWSVLRLPDFKELLDFLRLE